MRRLKTRFLTTYFMAVGIFFGAVLLISILLTLLLIFGNVGFLEALRDFTDYLFGMDRSGMIPVILLWFFLVAVAAFSIGAAVLVRLRHKVTDPIEELKTAADMICDGEYHVKILGAEDWEINELCRSLDRMRLRLLEEAATEKAVLADRNLLIANISHDMRTPITTIRGYLQAMEDGIAHTPEQIADCYSHIRAKTEFLEFLAADMTEYSDHEAGRLCYCFEDVELCCFLRDMEAEYREEVENKGFGLSLFLPQKEVYLRADRYRLQRVMQNLLSNAVKYNRPGGHIEVSLEEDRNYIYLCVADNGIGVKDDSLKKVFDSFYREDSSRGNVSGHGLGLAISRQIVEAHRGKIWMQSKENEGTQVFLCFPRMEQERIKE